MANQKATLKCHGCKEVFRREELISYCSPNAKTSYNYCKKCYEEKLARERFSQTVCQIFGLKAPGPRIWKERERLKETFGYTDDTIVDCLKYIYEVNGAKKLAESLCLITPTNVEKMMQLKRSQEFKRSILNEAMNTTYKIEYIDVRENDGKKEVILDNLDDYLEDF